MISISRVIIGISRSKISNYSQYIRAGVHGSTVRGFLTQKVSLGVTSLQTPSTIGPTLSRTSLGATALARTSISQASPSIGSPKARPALARVSAQNFPNLARASQISEGNRSAAGGGGLHRSSVIRAKQELDKRNEPVTSVTVTIEVIDEDKSKGVVYKNDGSRFAHSHYTLKLIQVHFFLRLVAILTLD
jgi:hypothetical protein